MVLFFDNPASFLQENDGLRLKAIEINVILWYIDLK
jgi:hypothetical protein